MKIFKINIRKEKKGKKEENLRKSKQKHFLKIFFQQN